MARALARLALLGLLPATAAPAGLLPATATLAGPPAQPGPRAAAPSGAGSPTLTPCAGGRALCGHLPRPLDPRRPAGGTIDIAFRLYPHRAAGPAAGTIVAQEGGPGLSSIASAAGFLALYAPLRADRDLLIVDARGTGASGAIACRPLQGTPFPTRAGIARCGRALGDRADLYGTGLAADDMAAVLRALGIARVDFYGDSYGTYFGQTFAARHPEMLRTIVLDGAYPVRGADPFYPNAGATLRRGIVLACARAPSCAALPGSAMARLTALAATLRQAPISGTAPGPDGTPVRVTADPAALGLALYNGASGPLIYREIDAASRALAAGDSAPLLRLIAESNAAEAAGAARAYSRGLYSAVSCLDYPQLYTMTDPPPRRRRQRDAAIAALRLSNPGIYAPLSIDEFRALPPDIGLLDACLDWPVTRPPYPPGQPIPARRPLPDVPTLVINGELDMLTTPAEGAMVAAAFPRGRHLIIANSFHVNAIGDVDDCAERIVRRFTASGAPGDTACAAAVKPVRLTPFFARAAMDAVPALPDPGNDAAEPARRLASAAVQTAGDAMWRYAINYSGTGAGLRGGAWRLAQRDGMARFTFAAARWAGDLAIDGTLTWNLRTGAVETTLSLAADSGARGTLTATWNDRASLIPAILTGTIDGAALAAHMPAP